MKVNSNSSITVFDITRKRVVSLDLSLLTYQAALNHVIELGKSNTPSYVCFSNVHMTMEANSSPEFQNMVNRSTFSFADGMPLVFALRILYGIRQERIAGMDFMGDALHICNAQRLSVFLFGLDTLISGKRNPSRKNDFYSLKIYSSFYPDGRQS